MTTSVEGLTFVITGGAQGIGAATARLAARRGAQVVIADLADEAGEALAEEIQGTGGAVRYQRCDVTDPDQVAALMAAAVDAFGGIDVLHNNAGIADAALAAGHLSLDELPLEAWDAVIAVNLRGPFLCARAALAHLRRSANASIVNACSTASFVARPRTLAYGASKGALAQLTKGLALDLADDGIRVVGYGPGMVETDMAARFLASSGDSDAARTAALSNYLVSDLGRPEDVAELVCFLASPAAAFVNGVVWPIDGGFLAWRGSPDERV
jgi:NAD(P)-dependent dehydrogenase (short-subunit alcohol dehydrogenase family)